MNRNYIEIESLEQLEGLLLGQTMLRHYAFQSIDFYAVADSADDVTYTDCIFMGCRIPESMRQYIDDNCYIFPALPRPYNMFRAKLYSAQELYAGYDPKHPESQKDCYDSKVYAHYLAKGKSAGDIGETLSRSLHDHSISDALHDMLAEYNERDVVAIMGGHSLSRCDAVYADVARLSKRLTERGRLMISGGGPGAMEATHLGAWFAGRSDEELLAAVDILCAAPRFEDEGWLALAFEVMERYPRCESYRSIGVPTWFYGHEPATPFASHIAKYFDNSIREDGLLAIAKGGVVYSPGSAGTMQEIFQDAAQNHYKTFGFASPMVFLGKDYWSRQMPVYPMLESLQTAGRYKNLILKLTDSVDEVIGALEFEW
ncbi:MAG: hypothetical protein E7127_04285 [Rikenellaceae bacterium]|nr:hypothetical protein [Rikenellaceae bacterium]